MPHGLFIKWFCLVKERWRRSFWTILLVCSAFCRWSLSLQTIFKLQSSTNSLPLVHLTIYKDFIRSLVRLLQQGCRPSVPLETRYSLLAYCWTPRICSGVIIRIILMTLIAIISIIIIIRAQSTAAAALNTRLEEDMEAIRQVVVAIISKLLLLISNHCYLLLIMGTMKQFGRSSLLNTTQW